MRNEETDMLVRFLDATGRPMSRDALARHLDENYPGLTPQTLPPLYLSEDTDFFDRLRAMAFPFTDELADAYGGGPAQPSKNR